MRERGHSQPQSTKPVVIEEKRSRLAYGWSLAILFSIVLWGACDNSITKTTPTITWATPSAITYGTALGAAQLNATASVPGSFAYTPSGSTVLNAGTQTLSTTFTPTDTKKYNTATASVSLTVNKATPVITWGAPQPISAGTALSGTQLNATANVPGTFAYNPPLNTVLAAGTQNLSVTFTPTDTADYNNATSTVSITVNPSVGVGPGGGTVHGFYGASVTVPAGALTTNVDIEIPLDSSNAPPTASTGVDQAGAMYALTPHGTQFAQAATVQIPFDSTRIPTDATPVIYKAEQGGSFVPVPTTVNGNLLTADVSNFSWVVPGFASTMPRMVYALNNANVPIVLASYKINKDGSLSGPTSTAPVATAAISVVVHPSRRFLYVTNGDVGPAGGATNVPANSVAVYQLDPVTGDVTGPTDVKPANGHPIQVVVHPTGKFIYVVNELRFGSSIGNVNVYSIDNATGALTPQGTSADLGGNPITALAFAPSGEFAYVTYILPDPLNQLNFDKVKTFAVSPTSGLFSSGPIGSANTGDNPWAIAVTRSGKFAYVASRSTQGSVNELTIYAINQTNGTLTLKNSIPMSGGQPSSLAMDWEDRFLFVGKQQPMFNRNVEVYSIDQTQNGFLTLLGGVLTDPSAVGPISVVAEPQAQFLYVEATGGLLPYAIGSSGTLLAGTPVANVFPGGNTGGVGDPFTFGASGTSPVWENNCTVLVNDVWVFDGCPSPKMSTGPGTGGHTGNPPPPAATFALTVLVDNTYGGSVVSSPAGINYNPVTGQNFFEHSFPNGAVVSLTAAPPDSTQGYDVKWTGACSGDTLTTTVAITQDQHCYISFTPVSLR